MIGTWHSFIYIQFQNTKSKHFEGSVGLMGSFSKGIRLTCNNITILEDFNLVGQKLKFLQSWNFFLHHQRSTVLSQVYHSIKFWNEVHLRIDIINLPEGSEKWLFLLYDIFLEWITFSKNSIFYSCRILSAKILAWLHYLDTIYC